MELLQYGIGKKDGSVELIHRDYSITNLLHRINQKQFCILNEKRQVLFHHNTKDQCNRTFMFHRKIFLKIKKEIKKLEDQGWTCLNKNSCENPWCLLCEKNIDRPIKKKVIEIPKKKHCNFQDSSQSLKLRNHKKKYIYPCKELKKNDYVKKNKFRLKDIRKRQLKKLDRNGRL